MPQNLQENNSPDRYSMQSKVLSTLTFRTVDPADIVEVTHLEERCFKDPYPIALFVELARDDQETFLVTLSDKKIVAYAVARRGSKRHHLLSIAVDTSYRHKGIATKLLTILEQRLDDGIIVLELRKSNIAALSLYEKSGFSKTGIISNYYRDGEDAITMEKHNVHS